METELVELWRHEANMLDKLLPKQNAIIQNGLVETMKHGALLFPDYFYSNNKEEERKKEEMIMRMKELQRILLSECMRTFFSFDLALSFWYNNALILSQ